MRLSGGFYTLRGSSDVHALCGADAPEVGSSASAAGFGLLLGQTEVEQQKTRRIQMPMEFDHENDAVHIVLGEAERS